MAQTFTLKIMTPTQVIFEEEVEMVVAMGAEGKFGILPHHAPMMASLQQGLASLYVQGKVTRSFHMGEGWSLTYHNKTTFLVTSCQPTEAPSL